MPFFILLFLFVFVPFAEISLLLTVSESIGGMNTILIVLLTAILGAYLVRQQGFATLANLQQQTAQGKLPALEIAEGVALLFAGAVLLTPGFITDAIGFALLTPPLRRGLIRYLASTGAWKVQTHYQTGSYGPQKNESNGSVIEGEYKEND